MPCRDSWKKNHLENKKANKKEKSVKNIFEKERERTDTEENDIKEECPSKEKEKSGQRYVRPPRPACRDDRHLNKLLIIHDRVLKTLVFYTTQL